nr:non-ribosomal peptide synthetase [Algicola sagamiensis]
MTSKHDELPTQPAEFIHHLKNMGIRISLIEDKLRLRADEGMLTDELKNAIRERKQDLIRFLSLAQEKRVDAEGISCQRPTHIPLSFAQQRLWFIDQLIGAHPVYNISGAIRLRGYLQTSALQESLQHIVQRHEILRTRICENNGEAFQVIDEFVQVPLTQVDLSSFNEAKQPDILEQHIQQALQATFDLQQDLMLKATLFQCQPEEHVLFILIHHIAADGWSIGVLIDEIRAFYAAEVAQQAAHLPPLPIQYADYACWQRHQMQGKKLSSQREFWLKQLQDAPPQISLPTDHSRPEKENFSGAHVYFRFSKALSTQLRRFANDNGVTLFTLLLSLFYVLLFRYSQQDDIVIGSPIANRNHLDIERLIGFFVNTLAFRQQIDGEQAFTGFLSQVSQTVKQAFDHQDLPFEKLVEALQPERSLNQAPVFQTAFALQNAPRPPMKLQGLRLEAIPIDNQTSKFDLFLSMYDHTDDLECVWEYSTSLFLPSTIESMQHHFEQLAMSVLHHPHMSLLALDILNKKEKQALTQGLKAQHQCDQAAPLFSDYLNDWLHISPHSTAILCGDERISYQMLSQQSDQVMQALHHHGAVKGCHIGVCLPKGVDSILAAVSLFKAGLVYVPLDPSYPASRLAYMMNDAQLQFVIVNDETHSCCSQTIPSIDIADLKQHVDAAEYKPVLTLDDIAYIIYTSGSTGQPKGVQLTQKGLAHLMMAQREIFQLAQTDRVFQFAPLSFDAAVWEIVMALGAGGSLAIHSTDKLIPDHSFWEIINNAQVSHVTLPPSFLANLPQTPPESLKTIITAGETLPQDIAEIWSKRIKLYNAYGPTEATVCATIQRCRPDMQHVSIGHPLPHVSLYILDEYQQPVPKNVRGELYIGGAGVATGYLNLPEKTASSFVDIPWSDEKVYRTGDDVKVMADGSLYFMGRRDQQTKVRGFRIELDEIQQLLLQHPQIQEAVVLPQLTSTQQQLVAYLTPTKATKDQHNSRLNDWSSLFETTYAQTDYSPYLGWHSSFTGEPLPEQEMTAWVEETVQSILPFNPKHVLEIGCGAGLLLNKIAHHCKSYTGTDLSKAALERLQQQIENQSDLNNITLKHQLAHDFSGLKESRYDVIVLNSVIQYFPSIDYLQTVLCGLTELVAEKGRIFIGDIRSLAHFEMLQTAIQCYRAEDNLTVSQLKPRVELHMMQEEELLITPEFFFHFSQSVPRACHFSHSIKPGNYLNELSLYRYQAILHFEPQLQPDWDIDSHDGQTLSDSQIAEILHDSIADEILIRHLTNPRLQRDSARMNWIQQAKDKQSIHDCPKAQSAYSNSDFQSLHQLALNSGYTLNIQFSITGQLDQVDAVFLRDPIALAQHQDFRTKPGPNRPLTQFANHPLLGKLSQQVLPQIKVMVDQQLPEYMRPSGYIMLDKLPMTPNGKVDRKALPTFYTRTNTRPVLTPKTESESILLRIWQDVLHQSEVSTDDNFFDIGGDSILSIQVISRANQQGLVLTTKDLFSHQTITALAAAARSQGESLQAEQGEITGQFPVLPIQAWYLENTMVDPHHFNQSVLMRCPADMTIETCQSIFIALLNLHDGLRSHFRQNPVSGRWEQHLGQSANTQSLSIYLHLEQMICVASNLQEFKHWVESTIAEKQYGFNLFNGPMMRCLLLRDQDNLVLFWTIHHLLVDTVSWDILKQDFLCVYQQIQDKKEVRLPDKTSSIQSWSNALHQSARHKSINSLPNQDSHELLWKIEQQIDLLPSDHPRLPDSQQARYLREQPFSLNIDMTQQLIQLAKQYYHMTPQEIALYCVSAAIMAYFDQPACHIDVEGHGRYPDELPFADPDNLIDLSRTVGWFTSLNTISFKAVKANSQSIMAWKENFRTAQKHRLLQGIQQYLTPDKINVSPNVPVCFNFQGQQKTSFSSGNLTADFIPLNWSVGPLQSPNQALPYQHHITAVLSDDNLQFTWRYSHRLYQAETIRTLFKCIEQQCVDFIAHCKNMTVPQWTPSDFPDAHLNQDALTSLLSNIPEVEDVYRLSPMQEGLLFETTQQPDSSAYIELITLRFQGALDGEKVQQCWQQMIHRHTALRSCFFWENLPFPHQIVLPTANINWFPTDSHAIDWQHLSFEEQAQERQKLHQRERNRGFDLTKAPLMRFYLIQTAPEAYELLWSCHHILVDGWSTPILFKEFVQLYREGPNTAQLPPSVPYRQYISWRHQQDFSPAKAFWKQMMHGIDSSTQLKLDRGLIDGGGINNDVASKRNTRQCIEIKYLISQELTQSVQSKSRKASVTLNTLLQSAWALLLSQYTGQNDVLFGTTVSGRPAQLPQVGSIIGLMINTLPSRVQIDWDMPLSELLETRHANQVECNQYADLPLNEIFALTDVSRADALFNTLFIFENLPFDPVLNQQSFAPGVQITEVNAASETSFPMTLVTSISQQQLQLRVTYDSFQFKPDSVLHMCKQYESILNGLTQVALDTPIRQIPLIDETQAQHAITFAKGTIIDFSSHPLFPDQFRLKAQQTPDAIAVIDQSQKITYAELDEQSERLAFQLTELGLDHSDRVGIAMTRSIEFVIGLMGILKLGASLIPLDKDWPVKRLKSMIHATQLRWVLTHVPTHGIGEKLQLNEFSLSTTLPPLNPSARARMQSWRPVSSIQAAYTVFTSGSTGTPKGVEVQHAQLHNYINAVIERFGFESTSSPQRFGMISTPNADLGYTMLFPALYTGGCVVMISESAAMDAAALTEFLSENPVDYLKIVPSHFAALWDEQHDVALLPQKGLIFGGESLKPNLVQTIQRKSPSLHIHNHYGPTETTIGVATYSLSAKQNEQQIAIGKPLANTEIYIVNQAGNLAPVGQHGELLIGGKNVCSGYLGTPQSDQPSIIPNPFGTGMIYRTGDLGQYLPSGDILFLGRRDDQVKIRGFRVELDEITHHLNQYPDIQHSFVHCQKNQFGHQQLIAYLVFDDHRDSLTEQKKSTLKSYLQSRLPAYMIPVSFMALPALPLNANGKINRHALPTPEQNNHSTTEPTTETEKALLDIWQSVLRHRSLSIHDNFFDLGGDSIISIQITARARDVGIKITSKQIFSQQTVAALAQVAIPVEQAETNQGEVTGVIPLSPIQCRFFEQYEQQRNHYNQAMLFEVTSDLQIEHFKQAFIILLKHHDALRACFYPKKTIPAQEYLPWESFRSNIEHMFHEYWLEGDPSDAEKVSQLVEEKQQNLNIQAGITNQLTVIRCSEDNTILVHWVIHHLVVDGVSWRILFEDLSKTYQDLCHGKAPQLSAKTSSCRDWVNCMNIQSHADMFMQELPYWLNTLKEPCYPMPYETKNAPEHPVVSSTARCTVKLPDQLTHQLLQGAHTRYQTHIEDLLLSALWLTLTPWFKANEIRLDLESHGRQFAEDRVNLSRTIGWFTSVYPIRLCCDRADIPHVIQRIKETHRQVPHHGIGFGILKYLMQVAELAQTPTSPIVFNYLGQLDHAEETQNTLIRGGSNFSAGRMQSSLHPRYYGLQINALVNEDQLTIHWDFSQLQFSSACISQFANDFILHLERIIHHCMASGSQEFTPSDFQLAELDEASFNQLAQLLDQS